jgi:predicted O-methyltransferase YrrM
MASLFIVTSTRPGPDRIELLSRLVELFTLMPPRLWVLVEEGATIDVAVSKLLKHLECDVIYTHCEEMRAGLPQRQRGLEIIRDRREPALVYIANDDNLYHPALFDILRGAKRIGIVPVGCLGPSGVERPLVECGKIVAWDGGWKERRYPVDVAGIVFHTRILDTIGDPLWPTNLPFAGETEFLERAIESSEELEVLTNRVLVWYKAAHKNMETLPGYAPHFAVEHLSQYAESSASGPIQRSEAHLLFAITAVLKPRYVVEVGFGRGHSAHNFLKALDGWGRLMSIDSARPPEVELLVREYSNFTFLQKRQEDIYLNDFSERIDLLFVDGSHEFYKNVIFFERVKNQLSSDCMIAVHDTGPWGEEHIQPQQRQFAVQKVPWSNSFYHQPGEVRFVQWIRSQYREWNILHFHSQRCLRHGITLLQRNRAMLLM